MKLLKNAASFEILTPEAELRDQLRRIERGGRTCYQSFNGRISNKSAERFVKMIIKRGHFSVLEHSCLSVRFKDVSRGFTHEMVRHRLAAYSQESTRYVDYARKGGDVDLDKFQVTIVAPPHRDEKKKVELEDGRKMTFEQMGEEVEKFYRALRKAGWNPQDARQILPIGLRAEIVVTTNFREWLHILRMRTSEYAHWEIRGVMVDLLSELQMILPPIFEPFKIKKRGPDGVSYAETELDV